MRRSSVPCLGWAKRVVLSAQHARGLVFVERHRALELGRPDGRIDLGRTISRVDRRGHERGLDVVEDGVQVEHRYR